MALFGFLKSKNDGAPPPGSRDKDGLGETLTAGRVFRYTHLPEILPRIRAIGDKFGHFAYLLALIYRSARLLPAGHPMLNPANIGRYGVRDVMATAANGLVMKRENMDQILIFGAVAMAMIMIVVQTALIAVYAFLGTANASAAPASSSMFTAAHPETDVMIRFLNHVFGFNEIFASGTDQATAQPGLYAILGFYSTGMMVIAVLIVIYYVITVVGESAQSGTPFGRRFNGLWAPIRLVLALGLLVPLGGGINAAQFMTLYVAKFGSGFASQGWAKYVEVFKNDTSAVMLNMNAPSMVPVGNAIFTAEVCRAVYNQVHQGGAQVAIRAEIPTGSQAATFTDADITWARGQGATKLIYIWTAFPGGAVTDTNTGTTDVAPSAATCGAIEVSLASGKDAAATNGAIDAANKVIETMEQKYVEALGVLVQGISGQINSVENGSMSDQYAKKFIAFNNKDSFQKASGADLTKMGTELGGLIGQAQGKVNDGVKTIKPDEGNKPLDRMKADALARGWGTAGIYYLEMSKQTQLIMDSVNRAYPTPISQGSAGFATDASKATDAWGPWGMFGSSKADVQVREAINPQTISAVLTSAGRSVTVPATNVAGNVDSNESFFNQANMSHPILMMSRWMFGTAFLTLIDQPTINPMARLIQGGSYILAKTETLAYWYIASQVGVVGGAIIGGISGAAVSGAVSGGALAPAGALAGMAAGALISTVAGALGGILWFFMTIGIVVGIVLFYLLPLLPFMYFFFSAVNWVIEVAEAFISMPLFALAHLRIDGDGLPGQTAMQGWMTLFGIMLRPLMIVVGLIIGNLVFGAGAYYLNSVYKYAIFAYNPAVGVDAAGALDFSKVSGFGLVTYLVLYVYLIYMLANSSFKLIDLVPDKMMRWIGGPQPFTGDRPVDLGNMQSMAIAGYAAIKEVQGVTSGIGDSLRKGSGGQRARIREQHMKNRANTPGGGTGGTSTGGTP